MSCGYVFEVGSTIITSTKSNRAINGKAARTARLDSAEPSQAIRHLPLNSPTSALSGSCIVALTPQVAISGAESGGATMAMSK
ncbi:MAG: hypothetical protein VW989_03605 [Rhodobiaceae bacterium]